MELNTMLLLGVLVLLLIAVILLIVLLCRQQDKHAVHRQNDELVKTLYDEFDHQQADIDAAMKALADDVKGAVQQNAHNQTMVLSGIQQQLLQTAQVQSEQAAQAAQSTGQTLAQLDVRMEQLRQSTQSGMTLLRQENDRQLTEMRKTVDEKLTETLNKRLNDSFQQVSVRLEQVYKGLGEMQTLATGVGDLKKVLTNVKTRGIWGEMQLGALLGQMLAPEQYMENVAVVPHATERVEFAVRLPGRDQDLLLLPIDSKFPQEDYLRLVDASQTGDPAVVEAARKALRQRILTEAKRIAAKYIKPPHTTDFAIMFLPVEGLYAEIVRDMDLVDAIQREERVVIAGPSTFAALLNALQMGFRTLAIEKRSGEVWKLLGAVKADFGHFADTLEKTQQRLRQASDTIDSAFSRSRTIERRLSEVETASESLYLPRE